jgi:hypothetical protein
VFERRLCVPVEICDSATVLAPPLTISGKLIRLFYTSMVDEGLNQDPTLVIGDFYDHSNKTLRE